MELSNGKCQTATQVKGLSPEIINIEEADSFHILESRIYRTDMARCGLLFRGLRPWYGIEWKSQELGRPGLLPGRRIFADNLKKRGCRKGNTGVGLTHSRGVAGVIPCASETHSKGTAVICKGEGKLGLYKEIG